MDQRLIEVLQKVVEAQRPSDIKVPKHLYHETIIDDLAAIKQEGLVPKKGDIIQTMPSLEDDYGDPIPDITFLSDDKTEVGGYLVWKIANKLGYGDEWVKVTWNDIEKYGLLVIVNMGSYKHALYKYVDEGEIYDSQGYKTNTIEIGNGKTMHSQDCCPPSIEQDDWFSYEPVLADRFVTGKKLVAFLKKVSTQSWIKQLK